MYHTPRVQRYGTFRDLTQAGCMGVSDGETYKGTTGPSTGNTPRITSGTTDYCFTSAGSR